jgi:hypothetical protein
MYITVEISGINMGRVYSHWVRMVIPYVAAGFLSASMALYGQDNSATPPPADQQQEQAPASHGGWRHVGEPAPQTQADQENGAPATPDTPEAQQAPAAPQAPYSPQTPSAPYAPQAPGAPQTYPQQPYGQPAYQPQNYPPPPVPAQITIPAGTYLTVRVNQALSSDKNQPGDSFTATLEAPVVANGVVVAEPGEMLSGRVAIADHHSSDHPGRLGLQLTSLSLVDGQQVPIQSQLVNRRGGTTPGGVEAGTVATTTGIGAAIGAAAGWGTGAAIGAAAGGLAGLIGVVVTHNHASVVYPEQELIFRLQAPVTVSTANAPQAFRYIEPGEYSQSGPSPAPGPYAGAASAPAPPPVYYGYPYWWGYPYYWGPSLAFYWGPGFYWGHGYWGGYRGGFIGGRGFAYGHVARR